MFPAADGSTTGPPTSTTTTTTTTNTINNGGNAPAATQPAAPASYFPEPVAEALAALAAGEVLAYYEAVEDVLLSFESREGYLEDIPAADTVLVLQALAAARDLAAELPASPLLPRWRLDVK